MIDLSSQVALETAIFVKWAIPDFETVHISDYNTDVTFGGDTYTNIGNLLSISGYVNNISASTSQLSIGLSGIASDAVSDVLNEQIRGSEIEIYRGLFDPTTHALLPLATNPVMRYKGLVTGFDVSDDLDVIDKSATTTITLVCTSPVDILNHKLSGRRTNPADFNSDKSMDRVPALANSNFNFGAPGDASGNINLSRIGVNK